MLALATINARLSTYDIVLVILMHLLDIRVNERLQSITFTIHSELWFSVLETTCRQQYLEQRLRHKLEWAAE